jgi:predicted HicB family RNase H-like nuclease
MGNRDLSYKEYLGSLEVSLEDLCLFGRVLYIDDLVSYEGQTVAETRVAFEEAVEHYLSTCKELQLTPNVPRQRRKAAPGG